MILLYHHKMEKWCTKEETQEKSVAFTLQVVYNNGVDTGILQEKERDEC